jgi:alpha-L-fucosidase 2
MRKVIIQGKFMHVNKYILSLWLILVHSILSFGSNAVKGTSFSTVKVDVDWEKYFSGHALQWSSMPLKWETAPFLGNGLAGTLINADLDSKCVKFWICRSDVGKLDFPGRGHSGNRMVIGTFNLSFKEKLLPEQCTIELDIWNAEAKGLISTTGGNVRWKAFVPADLNGVMINIMPENDELQISWVPDIKWKGEYSNEKGYKIFQREDSVYHPRTSVASGGFSVAWETVNEQDGSQTYMFSVGSSPVNRNLWELSPSHTTSKEEAVNSLLNMISDGYPKANARHRNWWHAFYRKSYFSFPDADAESYYWIQIYKLGSTARYNTPMMDNHGVWTTDSVYGFSTWDLNVQSTYRLHLVANHYELGKPLIKFLDDNFNSVTMYDAAQSKLRAGIRQQMFLRYKFFDTQTWEHGPEKPADGPAKFLWGCHNYWLHYRYSMDDSLLLPLILKLQGGINAMVDGLEKSDDDKYFIRSGDNWENWTGRNPTGLLAVLRWALLTAKELGIRIGYDKQTITYWDEVLGKLSDYEVGKYPDGSFGLYLGEGQMPYPHRHWSHLLMTFPLHVSGYHDPVIANSIDYWIKHSSGLNGENPFAGYSTAASIIMNAERGRINSMEDLINIFLYSNSRRGPNVWPSTLYREYGPVIETPFLFANALQHLALQSWKDTIKVFPAIPASWETCSFHHFRTEGAFLVSASRTYGKTDFIQIHSLEGERCLLKTDIDNLVVVESNGKNKVKRLANNLYEIDLQRGETILLRSSHYQGDYLIKPSPVNENDKNSYGLNEKFFRKRPNILRFISYPYSGELLKEKE